MAENRPPRRRSGGDPSGRREGGGRGPGAGRGSGSNRGKNQPIGRGRPRDEERSSKRRDGERRSDAQGGQKGFGAQGREQNRRGSDRRGTDRRPGDRRAGDFRRAREDSYDRTETQKVYDGPPIPDEITGKELDRSVSAALKSLPEKLALRVARHLVAAGTLLDSEPRTAYEHTLAARARAGRLAVVREAVGEAAYAAGEYAEALSELRAARRMNGATEYLPIMADCERALGRPDRALSLIKNAPVEKFAPALLAELRIVESGARRDRGELDAALRTLEGAGLMSRSRQPWLARLRYAYADTLVEADDLESALTWFHRTEAVDTQEITDAAQRAAEVEAALQASI